jgi:hypothetical protein
LEVHAGLGFGVWDLGFGVLGFWGCLLVAGDGHEMHIGCCVEALLCLQDSSDLHTHTNPWV